MLHFLVCKRCFSCFFLNRYKTGVILIVEMKEWKDGQVLQRLRGHDEDVFCLAWCPIPGENFKTYQDLDDPNSQLSNGYYSMVAYLCPYIQDKLCQHAT